MNEKILSQGGVNLNRHGVLMTVMSRQAFWALEWDRLNFGGRADLELLQSDQKVDLEKINGRPLIFSQKTRQKGGENRGLQAETKGNMTSTGRMFAHMAVRGVLTKGPLNESEKKYFVDYDDLSALFTSLKESPEIEGVLLEMNSPGGSVTGLPEARMVLEDLMAAKPVVVFTDNLMASAATYLTRNAARIVATPSAAVGSVGTVMVRPDCSVFWEQMGCKLEALTPEMADLKTSFHVNQALSPVQREYLLSELEEINAEFVDHMREARGLPDEAMRGQVVRAATKGMEWGFVDAIGVRADAVMILGELMDGAGFDGAGAGMSDQTEQAKLSTGTAASAAQSVSTPTPAAASAAEPAPEQGAATPGTPDLRADLAALSTSMAQISEKLTGLQEAIDKIQTDQKASAERLDAMEQKMKTADEVGQNLASRAGVAPVSAEGARAGEAEQVVNSNSETPLWDQYNSIPKGSAEKSAFFQKNRVGLMQESQSQPR